MSVYRWKSAYLISIAKMAVDFTPSLMKLIR